MKFHDAWLSILTRPYIRAINPKLPKANVTCGGGFWQHLSAFHKIHNALIKNYLEVKSKKSPISRWLLVREYRFQ